MAIKLSTDVRDARLDAIEAECGQTAVLKIFTGSPPADCAAANQGTQLVSMTLPNDWMAAASSGVKGLAGTWQGNAADTGTAGHFRVYASNGTTCHIQGTVSATGGGGDLTLSSASISPGQTVTLTQFDLTDANS